jgi:hypothetical protein
MASQTRADASAAPRAPTVTRQEKACTLVDRIKQLLIQGDLAVRETLRQEQANLVPLLGDSAHILMQQIAAFDFETALLTLQAARAGCAGGPPSDAT